MNKSLIIITLLLTVATFYGVMQIKKTGQSFRNEDVTQINTDWENFKTMCGKTYGASEINDKKAKFIKNRQAIIDHNTNSGESYTMDINCSADLDLNDHSYKVQLGTQMQKERSNVRFTFGAESLPTEVDWRTSGAVSPIKNQGQCGSCWAFSTIGALEGLNAITNKKLQTYSEQQLVDCAGGDYGNQGCNGGLMDLGFNYTQINGITTEDNYPYKGADGTCSYKSSDLSFQNKGYADVPANSQSQMMMAVARQPVAVAIDASSLGFQFYKKGVYTGKGLFHCGTSLDHGVLVAGYGSDNGKPFYLVKNSWGPSWGMSGYVEFAQIGDGPGTCGIQMQASYPTL